ncbi:MAG: hypothetical protein IJQ25_03375, partial [Oscillibacter sp.]|nr:hypothetical protein [Oscillibacter sp.]
PTPAVLSEHTRRRQVIALNAARKAFGANRADFPRKAYSATITPRATRPARETEFGNIPLLAKTPLIRV